MRVRVREAAQVPVHIHVHLLTSLFLNYYMSLYLPKY